MSEKAASERLQAEVNRLHRVLLRLAFAFQGHSPELDQQLSRLGNALRNGDRRVNIPKLIDEVVGAIGALDLKAGKPAKTAAAGEGDAEPAGGMDLLKLGFDRFLEKFALPEALIAPMKALRERIHEAERRRAVLRLIEEAAVLLSGGVVVPPSLPAAAAPEAIAQTTLAKVEAAGTQAAVETELARSLLLELLNKVNLPIDLYSQAQQLRLALEQGRPADETRRTGNAIVQLVQVAQARSQRELDELGNFLRQVIEGLDALRQQMEAAGQSRAESLRDSQALSQSVADRMQDIHVNVEQATDIQQLKTCINTEIEAIRSNVESFVHSERRRHREAEQAVSQLSVQLQELEGETVRLREGIEQERSRAVRDPLTGLANRLGLDEYMSAEYQRWRNCRDGLTVAVFDIDRFKSINDTYGHAAGDRVLKTVAEQFRAQVRQTDFIARFGGEEFVLILARATLRDGLAIAEKLRRHIEDCKFHYRDASVPVTVSCGIAEFRNGDSPDSVFERADQALYRAKNSGRNQCRTEADTTVPPTVNAAG